MSKNSLNRNDSVICKVTGQNQDGCFLSIADLDEKPIVRLYDLRIPIGSIILASIQKISEDRGYIKVSLDSIILFNNTQKLAA